MNNNVDTKKCTNCKTEILINNYEIHTVHCQKYFYYCCKCNKIVKRSKFVEHDTANHTLTKCVKCHQELDSYYLNDHLQDHCALRTVKCQFCDVDCCAIEISEHESYCGSRTEKCSECQEFIMLKYKTTHINSNHIFFKLSDEPGPIPSWQKRRRLLGDFIPDLSASEKKNRKKKNL